MGEKKSRRLGMTKRRVPTAPQRAGHGHGAHSHRPGGPGLSPEGWPVATGASSQPQRLSQLSSPFPAAETPRPSQHPLLEASFVVFSYAVS